MKCKKHPRYKGVKRPKICPDCWAIWKVKHPKGGVKWSESISGKLGNLGID